MKHATGCGWRRSAALGWTVLAGWLGVGLMAWAGNTCTWTGSWDTFPANTDDAIVVSSGGSLTWSNTMPHTVASWTQESTYAGTVTFQTVYGTTGFTNFTVSGDVALRGGAWQHVASPSANTHRLHVTVGGNLLVTNATISADGGGRGQNQGSGGTSYPNGATHGGMGGGNTKAVYGSVVKPTDLGSGSGSAGGGAILLTVAGTTTVANAGVITANGGHNNDGWTGSGGSLFLTTGWLVGSGALRANGGTLNNTGNGGGGGGRIAVVLTGANADFTSWNGTARAYAGSTSGPIGSAGTIFFKTANGFSTLTIDNNNIVSKTPMPAGVEIGSFSNVVIKNRGVLAPNNDASLGTCANCSISGTLLIEGTTALDLNTFSPTLFGAATSFLRIDNDANVTYPADWTIDNYTLQGNGVAKTLSNVTVGGNGLLTHSLNSSLNLTLTGDLTVLSSGVIHADGTATGGTGASSYPAGATHGGQGGSETAFNKTYGSILAPASRGSGASSNRGGGLIRLTVAGTTTLNASTRISADALSGDFTGSGGSVYLTTGWLTGSGPIRANGGAANHGSGSGGRVAIVLTGSGASFDTWSGGASACSSTSGNGLRGAAGTVYRATVALPVGDGSVTVDNNNLVTAQRYTLLPAFAASTESLSKTQWTVQNRGNIALVTNAAVESLTLQANCTLDLRGFALKLNALTVGGSRVGAGTYTAAQIGSALVIDSSTGKTGLVTIPAKGTLILLR